MDVILECTENGAGACRNESMILELRADLDAARAEVAALREQRDIAQAQRNDAYAALKIALSERDAARREVARLRAALASVLESLYATHNPFGTDTAIDEIESYISAALTRRGDDASHVAP